ncbi:MAG: hypothetical protein KatS3mg102_1926 [Planctomycetota bacterium]|nr:MAG: hypothetical protein KatS3mg102_1926 [Planctomycetota bacterium]
MESRDRPRILVIDDDPDVREMLRALLTCNGYEVHTCRDGAEGLAAVQALEPDLILVDLVMPGLGGLELCERLRQMPGHQGRPVIMLSARADLEHRVAGLRFGADEYLPKPFRRAEILAHVERKLQSAAAHRRAVLQQRRAAIGELAVAICHELNNPLAALRGEVQLALLEGGLPTTVRERLERLEALTQRMAAVLARLPQVSDRSVEYVDGTRMTDLWSGRDPEQAISGAAPAPHTS